VCSHVCDEPLKIMCVFLACFIVDKLKGKFTDILFYSFLHSTPTHYILDTVIDSRDTVRKDF
jgi:hypothetical protein